MTDRLRAHQHEGPEVQVERAGTGLYVAVERRNRGRWQRAVAAVLLGCALIGCAVKKPVAPVVTAAGQVRK